MNIIELAKAAIEEIYINLIRIKKMKKTTPQTQPSSKPMGAPSKDSKGSHLLKIHNQKLRSHSLKHLFVVNTVSMLALLLCTLHRAVQRHLLENTGSEIITTICSLTILMLSSIGTAFLSILRQCYNKMVILYYLVSFAFFEECFQYFKGMINDEQSWKANQYFFGAYITFLLLFLTRRAETNWIRLFLYLYTVVYHFVRGWDIPSYLEVILALMLLFAGNYVEYNGKEIEIQQIMRYGDVLKEIKRYRRILEDIPTGVCIIDHEMVLFANQAVKNIMGTQNSTEVFKRLSKVKIGSQHENSVSQLPTSATETLLKFPHSKVEANIPSPLRNNHKLHNNFALEPVEKKATASPKELTIPSNKQKTIPKGQEFSGITSDETIPRGEEEGGDSMNCIDKSIPLLFEQVLNGNMEKNPKLKAFRSDTHHNDDTLKFLNCEFKESEYTSQKTILDITTSKFNYKKDSETSLIVVVNDSTYRQEIENLALSNHYKNNILGYVSHEVNTPLNLIILLLESLKMHLAPPLYQQMVVPTRRTAKIMQYVIASMEVYCQIEQGTLTSHPSMVNLQFILDGLIEIFETQMTSKGTTLELVIKTNTPVNVKIDRTLYEQIVFNLLSNAVKYTSKGTIKVILTPYESGGKFYLKTEVHDTGVGLTARQLNDVRKRDILLKSFGLTSKSDTSLGMGLSISQTLAEFLSANKKNSFEVTSELGKGSVFTFYAIVEATSSETLIRDYQRKISQTQKTRSTFEEAHFDDFFKSFTVGSAPKSQSMLPRQACSENNFLKNSFDSFRADDEMEGQHNKLPPPMKLNSSKSIFARSEPTYETKDERIHTLEDELSLLVSPNSANQLFTLQSQSKLLSCDCFDILVVDDNDFNHLAVEMLLSGTPLRIQQVKNGQEAIEILEKGCKVDKCKFSDCCKMILMDINMPVMDGIQATKLLKARMKRKEIKYIPVIMNTANSTFSTPEKFEGMPLFDDKLPKPLNREKFLNIYNQSLKIVKKV